LFVDVGDGKVGLDITRVGGMEGALAPGGYGNGDPASFKNDKTDNTLKMLSVFQELSGQPFMVHRSRTDELPPEVKETAAPEPTPEATPATEEITYDEEQAVKTFAADSFQRITELLLRRDPEVDFDKYLAMAERGDTSDQILIASFEDIDKEGSRALTSKEIELLYAKGRSRLDLNIYSCSDANCSSVVGLKQLTTVPSNSSLSISSLASGNYLRYSVTFL
jgi:hypothetical protein